MMLPTFIIAGAGKSGTTSLWAYLKDHPEVCMAFHKEPKFFTALKGCGDHPDGISPRRTGNYSKGLGWYQRCFRHCGKAKAIGEASTEYMPAEDAPYLIKQHLPEVRLIFLLRDPVARVYSHYWQERKSGWSIPGFGELVEQRHPALLRYLYVSSYHHQLERYLTFFPKEQLSVYLYTDFQKDTLKVVQDVYHIIGVNSAYIPINLGRVYNRAQLWRSPQIHRFVNQFGVNLQLFLGWEIHPWFKNVVRTVMKLNSKNITKPPMPVEIRTELIKELTPVINYVEEFLDRPVPEWRIIK
jgi:hypothetical protein